MTRRPTIHEYYTGMLPHVASRGTCARRKVGAILVDQKGHLVATGYNGPPAGMTHCTETPCRGANDQSGDTQRCEAIHAEVNAILQAGASRREPHTLYCSTTPCFQCAKLLISLGIRVVIALDLYRGDLEGCELLERAGVGIFVWNIEGDVGCPLLWREGLITRGEG